MSEHGPSEWLRVSSLAEGRLARDVAAFRPTHIVSLVNPGLSTDRQPRFPRDTAVHQMVRHDVNSDEEGAPDAAAVADLIAWLSPVIAQVRAGDPVRVLSHCHQGISRSTAAALIALMLYHRGKAKRAFEDLLAITNKPWPNAKILRLAEAECGWGNGLSAIVDEYRAGFRHRPASYGRLQRRTGLDL